MSSLPDVFSLVRMRSNAFNRAMASAVALSGACWMAHSPGLKTLGSRACVCSSASTRSTFFTMKGFNCEFICFYAAEYCEPLRLSPATKRLAAQLAAEN